MMSFDRLRPRRMAVFRERHPYVGPVFWLLSVQYFVVQIIVASAWKTPFSLLNNTISDLGNTVCGIYIERYVCSPLHGLMNGSFMFIGVTIILGSLLIADDFRKDRYSRLGFWGMGLAGVGTILVGIFPENTLKILHYGGALLPFLGGNLALLSFGYSSDLPPRFRIYTRVSGIVALIGLAGFLISEYAGFALGGIERVTAYPQTIWLVVFGWYISMNRYRQRHGNKIIYS